MVWVAGVLVVLVALVLFGAFAWRLWVSLRTLGSTVARAGERVGDLTAGLEVRPPPARD